MPSQITNSYKPPLRVGNIYSHFPKEKLRCRLGLGCKGSPVFELELELGSSWLLTLSLVCAFTLRLCDVEAPGAHTPRGSVSSVCRHVLSPIWNATVSRVECGAWEVKNNFLNSNSKSDFWVCKNYCLSRFLYGHHLCRLWASLIVSRHSIWPTSPSSARMPAASLLSMGVRRPTTNTSSSSRSTTPSCSSGWPTLWLRWVRSHLLEPLLPTIGPSRNLMTCQLSPSSPLLVGHSGEYWSLSKEGFGFSCWL